MDRSSAIIVVLALIVGAVFLYQGGLLSDQGSGQGGTVVSFQELAKGQQASVFERINYRIKDADELTELWQLLHDASPLPSVDFSKNEVAAVFAGPAPIQGYDIGVIKVIDELDTRAFYIELQQPQSPCSPDSDGALSPYEIIVVPKTTLKLTHTDQPVATECPQL